ncbi:MAG: arylesterase [Candidatus Gracilibacteria bacterium]|nr:arylesterase [Candidatus Gracilibacteria bacterium]
MKKIFILFILCTFLFGCAKENRLLQIPETERPEPIIVALGDSLTAGYKVEEDSSFPSQLESLLQSNNYNYTVVNGGISGDTSQQLFDRITDYDDIDAEIFILSIGANDGLRKRSIPQMKQNIISIIDHLQKTHPHAEIVLNGMQVPIHVGLSYYRKFKETYFDIAEEQDIKIYDFFLSDVALRLNLNLDDGIHPNRAGYKIISENIFEFLEDEDVIIERGE